MKTHLALPLSTFFLLFIISPTLFSCAAAAATASARKHNEPQDLVRSSCIHARYPNLCLRTLSNYAGPANTPLDVAQAALKVSLAHARRASQYLKTLKASSSSGSVGQSHSNSKRQRGAVSDCAEQMRDSVDELKRSLEELQHLRAGTFQWQMSNAQTWVSAALTDGDTCLDGFEDGGADGKVKWDVKRRVRDVGRVTSNALYMINRLGRGGTGKPRSSSDSKN